MLRIPQGRQTFPDRLGREKMDSVAIGLDGCQLLNYLNANGCSIGLLINFKHPKAEVKRFAF
jgi:hypothetical protein